MSSILARAEDGALVDALLEGHPAAKAELFDRYGPHVERILVRILGTDAERADLINEIFARSLGAIDTLADPAALKAWLTGVTVLTAREFIRRRARGRWLRFFAADEVPDVEAVVAGEEVREALHRVYAVLDRLGADERIAFALRFIEGLELTEVARACGTSLNTVKRRLKRAEQRFLAIAEREPALEPWLKGRGRWTRE